MISILRSFRFHINSCLNILLKHHETFYNMVYTLYKINILYHELVINLTLWHDKTLQSGLHFIQNKYSLYWIMIKKNMDYYDFIFKWLFILHCYVVWNLYNNKNLEETNLLWHKEIWLCVCFWLLGHQKLSLWIGSNYFLILFSFKAKSNFLSCQTYM